MAVLDWGSGVWIMTISGGGEPAVTIEADRCTFGFNLGYGFNDRSSATGNVIFLCGRAIA